jgi:hypothetical protein
MSDSAPLGTRMGRSVLLLTHTGDLPPFSIWGQFHFTQARQLNFSHLLLVAQWAQIQQVRCSQSWAVTFATSRLTGIGRPKFHAACPLTYTRRSARFYFKVLANWIWANKKALTISARALVLVLFVHFAESVGPLSCVRTTRRVFASGD